MSLEHLASQDFERAVRKAFWRKVYSWMVRETNDLLPFDDVRERLAIRGQHYIGLQQVPIDQIVGSTGRYRDFDRAFLPIQTRTKDRWKSIDKAHYAQINLPPVDLYKVGEAYFVRDGNHRVSVARERGQVFVDAYVTEIEIPVPFTPGTNVDELVLQQERASFMEQTHLDQIRPQSRIETTQPGEYEKLFEHISVHRWYLGEQRNAEVSYVEAVASWYDQVYLPLVEAVCQQEILGEFPGATEADLYLWIMDYQWSLREAYKEESGGEEIPLPGSVETAKEEAGRQVADEYPFPSVRKLIGVLKRAAWLDEMILQQEQAAFLKTTQIIEVRPQAEIVTTLPGQYEKLLEHIAVHRWYLGEQRNAEVPYVEAVASWYDNVYCPLLDIIREQNIMEEFPGRTETDLYLWIMGHQWYLQETYGGEVPVEQAAEQFAEDYSQNPVKKIVKALKKAAGKK